MSASLDAGQDTPQVVLFPPLVFAAGLVLGLVLHFLWPLQPLPELPSRIVGLVVMTASVMLARLSEVAMTRRGTAIRPDRPTTALVTDGPFSYSRNPLYLASIGVYASVALLVPALWPLILLAPVLIALRFGVVTAEERYLERKFGAAYTAYRSRVRRWL